MVNFIENETNYKQVSFQAAGNTWTALQASGKFNYIAVQKVTNNPYRGLGREFTTWEQAISTYKNPVMKAQLILAQSTLK